VRVNTSAYCSSLVQNDAVRRGLPDADYLGWETAYVALTKLQADAFVTSDCDLAEAVSGLVQTATVDALHPPSRVR
jgi:hypothetical protein